MRGAVFLGSAPAIKELLSLVQLVAATDATVLLTGETGTGKEMIATALHEAGPRRTRPFVAVNCGALSETLLQSELFGYVRGAFTGADANRPGKFEAADTGTIFLDEIADMSSTLQVHLLRILQSGEYAPVGSASNRRTNVRVIAASNQPLKPLVDAGIVRADLYYRLNVVCLDLPPLRERRDDIPELVAHFVARYADRYGRKIPAITPAARELLQNHWYPGNIRELENAVCRAVILGANGTIDVHHLPREMHDAAPSEAAPQTFSFQGARARAVSEFERDYLIKLMQECGGIISRAASRCGLSERNFHIKLRKYGLRGSTFRTGLRETG